MDWGKTMSTENPPDDLSPDEEQLFAELSDLAQSISSEDRHRETPPPDIWAGISAELASSESGASPVASDGPEEANGLIDLTAERSNRASEPVADLTSSADTSRTNPLLLVAAAVIALVVIGGAAIAFIGGSEANPVYAAEISNTDLPEPFDGTATATVEVDDNPMIVIDFDDPLPMDEPLELWVLTADGSEIVSVGLVEPGATTFDWPEGLEPAEYPLVDISVEPDDGDETHSGRSILRGELMLS